MERVQVLIDKLIQQKQQKDSIAQMLITVQSLQQELIALQNSSRTKRSGKVAVVLPAAPIIKTNEVEVPETKNAHAVINVKQEAAEKAEEAVKPEEPINIVSENRPEEIAPEIIEREELKPEEVAEPLNEPEPKVPQPEIKPEPVVEEPPKREEYFLQKPVVAEVAKEPEPARETPAFDFHFDAMEETPTLLQQQPPPKEIHELISEQKESLNDRLKQNKTELAHVLKESPIKDLRKAIGVNDKFVFVNELFRGDETMYERSIKTINSFHILPEAEYWINRELKVKLGWNDNKEIVQHFYHLVRRRFL